MSQGITPLPFFDLEEGKLIVDFKKKGREAFELSSVGMRILGQRLAEHHSQTDWCLNEGILSSSSFNHIEEYGFHESDGESIHAFIQNAFRFAQSSLSSRSEAMAPDNGIGIGVSALLRDLVTVEEGYTFEVTFDGGQSWSRIISKEPPRFLTLKGA